MTFAYVPNTPVGTNDPADDQPDMNTNFQSIASLIAIDHVGFNLSGGGDHLQVTFNSNNVPSVPTSPPVLFTNDVNSIPALYFYSGTASQSSNQYYLNQIAGSVTQSSTMVLGSMIIKWGVMTVPAAPGVAIDYTLSFTNPFPNNLFNVQLSGSRNSSSTQGALYINTAAAFNTTGFGFTVLNEESESYQSIYWVAIGN